jgi:CRISPR-associated exonuclease Cas4
MIYGLVFLLLVLGFWLLIAAERRRKESGLPRGRLISADMGDWLPVDEPLYDRHLGLTGKPDYLVKTSSGLVPVEVKSSNTPAHPYDAHIFQLAAYCLLIESHYGQRPPYGIIQYPGRTFAVDYTHELETALLEIVDEMRQRERQRSVERSHQIAARCQRCGFRYTCDQRL